MWHFKTHNSLLPVHTTAITQEYALLAGLADALMVGIQAVQIQMLTRGPPFMLADPEVQEAVVGSSKE